MKHQTLIIILGIGIVILSVLFLFSQQTTAPAPELPGPTGPQQQNTTPEG